MPKRKHAKKKATTPEQIFDAIQNGAPNLDLYNGELDGEPVVYVGAERSDGEIVQVALLLDDRTRNLLDSIVGELRDEEDDQGDEGDADERDQDLDEDGDDELEPFVP